MKKIISSILLFILLLVGCNNQANNSFDSVKETSSSSFSSNISSLGPDIYDSNEVDIKLLEDNFCVFFEDMVFAESNKNYVFFIENNNIKERKVFDKVEFNKNNFDDLIGKDLLSVIEKVGIPTYRGKTNELSLDYSCVDGYLRKIFFVKENSYVVEEIQVLNKLTNSNFRGQFVDKDRNDLLTLKETKLIKEGMCMDDVIHLIGRAHANKVSSSRFVIIYDVDDGSEFLIDYVRDYAIDCQHIKYEESNISKYSEYRYYYVQVAYFYEQ